MLLTFWYFVYKYISTGALIAATITNQNSETTKYEDNFPNSIYYTFGINLDSLIINTKEIHGVKGEKHKIKMQEGNLTDFYNDYYMWGRFSTNKSYSVKKTRLKAKSHASKQILYQIYSELLPRKERRLFKEQINYDSLDCYFIYYYPFRGADIKGLELLMFEKTTKTYYYLQCTGRYVKLPEIGIEIEDRLILNYKNISKKQLGNSIGRYFGFPFTGYIFYTSKVDKKLTEFIIGSFFEIKTEKYKIGIKKWIELVNKNLFHDVVLQDFRIDNVYYAIDYEKNSKDENLCYTLTFLAYDKVKRIYILSEICYEDYWCKNKNQFIYNLFDGIEDKSK